jgi:hypothetical protein
MDCCQWHPDPWLRLECKYCIVPSNSALLLSCTWVCSEPTEVRTMMIYHHGTVHTHSSSTATTGAVASAGIVAAAQLDN